jgi:hypothetical protein
VALLLANNNKTAVTLASFTVILALAAIEVCSWPIF